MSGLGGINLFGNVNLFNLKGTNGDNLTEATAGSANIVSSGNAGADLANKIQADMDTMKAGLHEKLSNFAQSDFYKNTQKGIQSMADSITKAEIPNKIRDAVRGFREKIVSSGVIGKVAGKVLDLVYQVGGKLPVIGPLVGAVASIIPGSSVETIINNSLTHIEEKFFDPLEDEESNYQKMRKEILEAVSCKNITRVTLGLFSTGLDAGIEATKEGATWDGIKKQIKTSIDTYITGHEEYESIKDAGEFVLPALGEMAGGALSAAGAIASDEGIHGAVETALTNAPNLIDGASAAMGEASSLLSSVTGSMGGLSGITSSLSGLTSGLGGLSGAASSIMGLLKNIKL